MVFREKGGLIHSDQTGVSQPVMAAFSNIPVGTGPGNYLLATI